MTAGAQAVPRSQNHFLSSGVDSVSAVILETSVEDQPQFGAMMVCACVEEEFCQWRRKKNLLSSEFFGGKGLH